MKYAFIDTVRAEHALSRLCRVLEVSRSGYHQWRRGGRHGARVTRREQIDRRVRETFEAKKRRYGAPRLARELGRQGFPINRKSVAASLSRQGLRARARRRFRTTTHSNHDLPVSPDLLEQDFRAAAPNKSGCRTSRTCGAMTAGPTSPW